MKREPGVVQYLSLIHIYGQYDITYENIELMKKGVINPKDFYSHVKSVEDIQEVLRLVETKEAIKVVVKFD